MKSAFDCRNVTKRQQSQKTS